MLAGRLPGKMPGEPGWKNKTAGVDSGRFFWLGIEDSNLGIQIQSLLSYH